MKKQLLSLALGAVPLALMPMKKPLSLTKRGNYSKRPYAANMVRDLAATEQNAVGRRS